MKTKLRFRNLIIPFLITFFLFSPDNVVWGGQSFQTVPTIGPSPTSTRTSSSTVTQSVSTRTPIHSSTSTAGLITPVTTSTTFTAEATRSSISATVELQKTESISATDDLSTSESTSVVVLPVVANGDTAQGEQSNQDINKPIPAFVFPLVVVLLFVIIYLYTRWSLKKSQEANQPK